MKSLRKTVILICAAALAGAALLVAAESPQQTGQDGAAQSAQPTASRQGDGPPVSEAQARIRVNSNLVILPVTVKDRSGELVPDLRKDEFRVLEDNVEQHIDVFTAEAFPLSMVILIDNDLKDKDADQVRASLDAIIAGLSLSDEAFICRFDQFFHPGKGFTTDQDKLLAELKRTNIDSEPAAMGPPGGPFSSSPTINNHSAGSDSPINNSAQLIKGQPTKALDDAVFGAAQLLHDRGRDRRKVILLISDGVDGGKKFNNNTYDAVVKTLLHDNIAVYSVAVSSAFLERKLSRLVNYARDSGGDVYFAVKRDTLEQFYSRVTEEARNQYTLAYVPRGTDRGAEYHSVEVRVKREGLTIKTREGYFTGAIPAPTPQSSP
jgi:Ca-activated chloride channel homolog